MGGMGPRPALRQSPRPHLQQDVDSRRGCLVEIQIWVAWEVELPSWSLGDDLWRRFCRWRSAESWWIESAAETSERLHGEGVVRADPED